MVSTMLRAMVDDISSATSDLRVASSSDWISLTRAGDGGFLRDFSKNSFTASGGALRVSCEFILSEIG